MGAGRRSGRRDIADAAEEVCVVVEVVKGEFERKNESSMSE